MKLNELFAARKVLTDKIADMNWQYSGRVGKLLEINAQLQKIDTMILALTAPKIQILNHETAKRNR